MEQQQLFAQRLAALLEEKHTSQQEFAEAVGCSRQSVNFYCLGKRLPDIVLAGQMARILGVSCDYLIGISNYRDSGDASVTVEQAGIGPEVLRLFGGLNILAHGAYEEAVNEAEAIDPELAALALPMQAALGRKRLRLLNELLGHDRFGLILHYLHRYEMFQRGCAPEDGLAMLMLDVQSPETGAAYGSPEEQRAMQAEFCLYVACNYLREIAKDIAGK